MTAKVPWQKALSHSLKSAWYELAPIDAAVDAWTESAAPGSLGGRLREHALYRLLPERRVRALPFEEGGPAKEGRVLILSLVPPEDSGGGSRPAQLGVELHRRGYEIEWRWALPIYPWPRRRRPVLSGVDARPVGDGTGRASNGVPFDFVLLEAPHPGLWRLASEAERRGPVVYDAIDLWDGSLGAGWYDRETEDLVLAGADVRIASAASLRDEVEARSGHAVELLPNAVDDRLFRPQEAGARVLERGAPTVVFVGALWGEWVDLGLIESLVERCPKAVVHLVGPAGTQALPRHSRIHVHGPKPRHEIPALLASADVAIVPFAIDRLTAAVSPLKAFEYLSMERPVVATDLAELRDVPGVTLAADAAEFASAVERVAGAPFPVEAVRAYLSEHTWSRRVDRLLEITRSGR